MNYGDIQTSVLFNLGKKGSGGNPDNPEVVAQMPGWFVEMQSEYQNDRNYWFMKAVAERQIDQSTNIYEFPPGYKEGLTIFLNDTVHDQFVELFPVSDLDVLRTYNPSTLTSDRQQPTGYQLQNTSVAFWPWPDQAYVIRTIYWGDLTIPDGNNLAFTNYWMDRFPQFCIRWLTKRGFQYLQQWDSADQWTKMMEKSIADIRAQNVSRMLGSDFHPRPRTSVYGANYNPRNGSWMSSYYL